MDIKMSNKTKQNLKNKNTWMRILYMLLFVVAYAVAEFLLTAVVVVQVFFKLITGSLNERLLVLGKQTSQYVYDILRFMTFNSEDMPFPFKNWPDEKS
jgi:hypothetical protein